MELIKLKNGYIVNLSRSETKKLNLSSLHNKNKQIAIMLNLAGYIIRKIGITYISTKLKLTIAKKGKYLSILIMPINQPFTSFAVRAETEKELLTLTEQLYKNNCSKLCVSSVYIFDENYYLVIAPITKSNKPRIICTEFCLDLVGDTHKILDIQRFGLQICNIDAIEKLGEAISK